MVDIQPYLETAAQVFFVCVYLWLVWSFSKDWWTRLVLASFLVLPSSVKMLLLGCIVIWALRAEQQARDAAAARAAELEKKVLRWGPRGV